MEEDQEPTERQMRHDQRGECGGFLVALQVDAELRRELLVPRNELNASEQTLVRLEVIRGSQLTTYSMSATNLMTSCPPPPELNTFL